MKKKTQPKPGVRTKLNSGDKKGNKKYSSKDVKEPNPTAKAAKKKSARNGIK